MRPYFSEFSYGFALPFEITNTFRPWLVSAPTFPSLIKEKDLGYDVKFPLIGCPLFLQFKLSEFMKSRRAKQWPYHGHPFYRVEVYKRLVSNQHNLLKQLASSEPDVYYAAPAFNKEDRFQQLFVANEIISGSAFIPIRRLPRISDDQQHYVTFSEAGSPPVFRWHSDEGVPIEGAMMGKEWLQGLHRQMEKPRDLGDRFFLQLRFLLHKILEEITDRRQIPLLLDRGLPLNRSDDPRAVFREIGFLLATYFGAQMFVLTSKS
jgi:hypothetical protein